MWYRYMYSYSGIPVQILLPISSSPSYIIVDDNVLDSNSYLHVVYLYHQSKLCPHCSTEELLYLIIE